MIKRNIFFALFTFVISVYGSDSRNMLSVTVLTPKINIDENEIIGTYNGSTYKMKNNSSSLILGSVNNLDHKIIQSFEGSFIDGYFETKNFENYSPIIQPKLILQPLISSLHFAIKGGKKLNKTEGVCQLECYWEVYTIKNKKERIGVIKVFSKINRKKESTDLILNELISASAKDLVKIDTLYHFLSSIQKEYLKETKPALTEISGCEKLKLTSNKEMLRTTKQTVVTIQGKEKFGSGVTISRNGYIVTNYHVIEGEKEIQVKLNSEMQFTATVVKSNRDYDLALLKIEGNNFLNMNFANSDSIDIGETVFAIGTPVEIQLGQTITKGIISGKREINGVELLQTDATINHGNSGGPIVNEKGEIVGIATMKMIGEGIEGIGFCLPSNIVVEMLGLNLK